MSYLKDTTSAVKSLCPEAEFVMYENDYSTIQWHIKPDSIPTAKQVSDELQRLNLA